MSVYKKLSEARVKFHSGEIKKSGANDFAKYKYLQLDDFIVRALGIFNELGLCGIVSFSREEATLRIVDVDDNSEIVITSPMGSASLKGVHEVQNIGAVETYQRRYLWVAALEIVEHDALDASVGADDNKDDGKKKSTPADIGREYAAYLTKIEQAANLIALKAAWDSVAAWGENHPDYMKKLADAANARKATLKQPEGIAA